MTSVSKNSHSLRWCVHSCHNHRIDNYLRQIAIELTTNTLDFGITLFGEGVTQILRYEFAAITNTMVYNEVYYLLNDIILHKVWQNGDKHKECPQHLQSDTLPEVQIHLIILQPHLAYSFSPLPCRQEQLQTLPSAHFGGNARQPLPPFHARSARTSWIFRA